MTSQTETEPLEDKNECKANFSRAIPEHTVEHKDGGTVTIKNYTAKKAVLLYCSWCMGFESDPRQCTDKLCPFWPFRGYTSKNRVRYDEEKQKSNGLILAKNFGFKNKEK
jgi:hypothetical protein